MAHIQIRRSHRLGLDQARQAVGAVAQQLQADLQARHHWQGDRLEFECPGANGHIAVSAGEVSVDVRLSWLLTPAKGRIERSIQEYLERYLKQA